MGCKALKQCQQIKEGENLIMRIFVCKRDNFLYLYRLVSLRQVAHLQGRPVNSIQEHEVWIFLGENYISNEFFRKK